MNPKCIAQVTAAAGRALTPSQLQAIEDRLTAKQRQLARQDPQAWAAKPADAQVLEAAQAAMQDIQAEAARKVENAQRQALKTIETTQRIADLQQVTGKGRHSALADDLRNTGLYAESLRKQFAGQLMSLIEAAASRQGSSVGRRALQFLFDAENPQMTRDLALEIFSQGKAGTGNQLAKDAAEAWLQTIEGMRQRFNDGGGDVGKLEYGYLPQPHDALRIRKMDADAYAQKVLPMLDRRQYVNADGKLMTDAQVLDVLRAAHETLATDGLNKMEPGQFRGTGARANRGSEGRVLHFRDGDAYLAYNAEFGAGGMYDAMLAHVGGLSKDIALVERMGPNPSVQFRLQNDLAVKADGGAKRVFGNYPQAYWDILSGNAGTPQSARLAEIGMHVRNIQTFAKLGGAVISSITDVGTILTTAGFNKLPYWDLLTNTLRAGTDDAKAFANAHGMIADSMLNDLNRWQGEHIANNWSGRLANSVMKLSFMNAWTDTMRRGFSMTMQAGLGRMARVKWDDLAEFDRWRLSTRGVTADDWAVVNTARLDNWRGQDMLTPDGIRAADIATARPADLQRIRDQIATQTADLSARNAKDQQWIQGRIDKFDAARDALNRQVKAKHANRLAKNEKATGPLLERMALLDAQREAAKLQADMEADFNRFATQDEVRQFLNAVEDGASADIADVGGDFGRGGAKAGVRQGVETAESIGRRYGEAKGRLERRMQEIENRITEMDRKAGSETNADAKAAQKKADEMLADLREFIARSQERQQNREAVIQRIQAAEAPRIAAETERIRNEVAAKVLGFLTDEAETAVINPDLATRAIQSWGGSQAGSIKGEIARATMQFKSFPIAMISRHWRRMLDTPQGLDGAPAVANKAAYTAALLVSTTALGAIAWQLKQVKDGKDPVDMTTPKFWTQAFMQGGGAGFLGDLVLGDSTDARSPQDALSRMIMGPTWGSAAELWELTKGNVDEWRAGKDTHAGAEAVRFAKGHAPLVNLWYTKAALDHLLLHGVQENLSPGYMERMKARARKEWDQDFWWEPGESAPDRAPDFSAIGGE